MAKNLKWQDEYWLLLLQIYLQKPVGIKPMYSKEMVDLSMELHIAPNVLFNKMCQIANLETPRIEYFWELYGNNPRKLKRAVNMLREMWGFNNALAFYEGVETQESFEKDFKPISADSVLTPVMLTLILDLYFRLTPITMVEETPEVQEIAKMMKIKPQEVVEAMEAGCSLLLIDEDTSATNFMVRDSLMASVVSPDKEPITPFLERARDLYAKAGISTILVAGSSGAFFHIADTVIQMDNYVPVDIKEKVIRLLPGYPLPAGNCLEMRMPSSGRIMTKDTTVHTRRNYYGKQTDKPERIKIRVNGTDGFSMGHDEIDLRYIEQIVDQEQMAALADILKYVCENMVDGRRTLGEAAGKVVDKLDKEGFGFFRQGGYIPAGLAMPRAQEIYACLNRFRRP